MTIRWGVKWNGDILWNNCETLLFHKRKEARNYIDSSYGYMRDRKDLRRPPFNWRMPKAVRVQVILKQIY